jgi:hypothetical protein
MPLTYTRRTSSFRKNVARRGRPALSCSVLPVGVKGSAGRFPDVHVWPAVRREPDLPVLRTAVFEESQ